MPLWVLYLVPPLVGVGVFVTGVGIDGGEFEPVDGFLYALITAMMLFFVTVGTLGLTYTYTELQPAAITPFGLLAKRTLWGSAAFGFIAFGLLSGYFLHSSHAVAHLYLQSFWLLTACLACLGVLVTLLSIAHRRTIGGRMTGGIVISLLALAAWQHGVWCSWRESVRYEWMMKRATLKPGDDDEAIEGRRYWAERMIELRPDDWRGYVQRYGVRKRMGSGERFSDAEEALRLGCNTSFRSTLMFDYHAVGRFDEAVREGKAVVSHQPRPEDELLYTSGHLAAVQLDAGEYDGVIAYHTHMKALGRENGRTRSLAGCVFLSRGEYASAKAVLSEPTPAGAEDPDVTLAWLLATCPDPAIRDGARAVTLIDEYLPRIEQALRDEYRALPPERRSFDGKPRKPRYRALEEVLAEVKRATQPARAAALAETGRWEEARAVFDQWKKDEGWDRQPHHNGFWARRYARLDACLREGKPYRDEP